MTIKTRFNIGDKAFFLHENKVQRGVVNHIYIHVDRQGAAPYAYYSLTSLLGDTSISEDRLFATKEALLISL